jgi:hypothetical protein
MNAEPSLKSKYSPETKERACYKTTFIIVIYKEKQCEVGRKVGFLRRAKTRRGRAEFRRPQTERRSRKFPRKYANFLH